MSFVVLLHGRGSSKKQNTDKGKRLCARNRAANKEFSPEEFIQQGESNSFLKSRTAHVIKPQSPPSVISSASSSPSSNRSMPCASSQLSSSINSSSSSSVSSTTSSDSDLESSEDEPNIGGLNKHTHNHKLRRFKHRKSHDPSTSDAPIKAISRTIAHQQLGPKLSLWKFDPGVFKTSAEYSKRWSLDSAIINQNTTNTIMDQSVSEPQKRWPDELVLNTETFEVWFNGKKYRHLRFVMHHLDDEQQADELEQSGQSIGEIHLRLPLTVETEVKQVQLVAPFICNFDIWNQLSSKVLSRHALMNLHCILGLRIGHWKLQLKFHN